ncbi:MAG: DUF2845 domain-containing protein [Deltaproteobacteria bacterium]|nr:DUF2845 domain-containing protein [Deltaproteobacteria bacterium]
MKPFSSILIFLFPLLLLSRTSFALRCGNQIVSEGDTSAQVLAKCGEPQIRDDQQQQTVEKLGSEYIHKISIPVEDWIYDFGSNRLVQVLRFENNRLSKISSGGYGGYKNNPERCQNSFSYVSIGETKAQILLKCGLPSWKSSEEEILKVIKSGPYSEYLKSNIEIWNYQMDVKNPVRVLRFRNGVLEWMDSQ